MRKELSCSQLTSQDVEGIVEQSRQAFQGHAPRSVETAGRTTRGATTVLDGMPLHQQAAGAFDGAAKQGHVLASPLRAT